YDVDPTGKHQAKEHTNHCTKDWCHRLQTGGCSGTCASAQRDNCGKTGVKRGDKASLSVHLIFVNTCIFCKLGVTANSTAVRAKHTVFVQIEHQCTQSTRNKHIPRYLGKDCLSTRNDQ